MLCSHCGSDNKDGAASCRRCGTPIASSTVPQAQAEAIITEKIPNIPAKTSSSLHWFTLITGLVLFMALIWAGTYFYLHRYDPANPEIVITSPENIPAAAPPVEETTETETATDGEAPQDQAAGMTPPDQSFIGHDFSNQGSTDGTAIDNNSAGANTSTKTNADGLSPQNNTDKQAVTTDSIAATPSVIDPHAPCPAQQFSCYRANTDNRLDTGCPNYKAIWAYYSTDKGANWKQAGCYATEIDASKALKAATRSVVKTTKPVEKSSIAAPSVAKLGADTSTTNHIGAAATAIPEQNLPQPNTAESEGFEAKFKGAFGLTVEKRKYRTAEMKQKALDLWSKERKLLEPDGSINERYAIQPQSSGLIPGH